MQVEWICILVMHSWKDNSVGVNVAWTSFLLQCNCNCHLKSQWQVHPKSCNLLYPTYCGGILILQLQLFWQWGILGKRNHILHCRFFWFQPERGDYAKISMYKMRTHLICVQQKCWIKNDLKCICKALFCIILGNKLFTEHVNVHKLHDIPSRVKNVTIFQNQLDNLQFTADFCSPPFLGQSCVFVHVCIMCENEPV